jgi:hypothetical protein
MGKVSTPNWNLDLEDIILKKMTFVLIIGMVFLPSCEKKHRQPVRVWDGKYDTLGSWEYPVCIIWFRESARNLWTPYKAFDTADEIRNIINSIDRPDVNEPLPELRTRNKLTLIYYLGEPAFLRAVEVYFDVNDGVFIGPRGQSRNLGQMLLEKEESGLSRYRFHTPPYDEAFIERAKESEQYLRNELRELKAEKQAGE